MLDVSEEGCDSLMVELIKVPDKPLGMGIGKRPRGILVTSVQPNTPAADKLKVKQIFALLSTERCIVVCFIRSATELWPSMVS